VSKREAQGARSNLLLSATELHELTGFCKPYKMIEWLVQRGWVFEPPLKRGDIPKVDRTYFHARMSGQAPGPRRVRPNLEWMTSHQ
jgi:Domain of unknown function (DUF4224)